jgi:hypothetical protein
MISGLCFCQSGGQHSRQRSAEISVFAYAAGCRECAERIRFEFLPDYNVCTSANLP